MPPSKRFFDDDYEFDNALHTNYDNFVKYETGSNRLRELRNDALAQYAKDLAEAQAQIPEEHAQLY